MSIEATGAEPQSIRRLGLISLAPLAIVFGEIGTSPLYTLKDVFDITGPHPEPATTLGTLSLILWTLFLVTPVKYGFAMRFDNDGEGGIIAITARLKQRRPVIVLAGLFGAALIYTNGAIMPAMTVLAALEGVKQIAPSLQTYVVPAATAILLALFAAQPFGTLALGRVFGPVMLVWFLVIAALGAYGVLQHPSVFVAVDPRYGLDYLSRGGWQGFLVLGAAFLCVTGAEALYADMGFFGLKPIRLSWQLIIFPALILNYAGQVAIVLAGAPTNGNIFYGLCPGSLLTPLIVLATIAAIIASQSTLTGAQLITREVIQLGWLPRMTISQTSEEVYGCVYVGTINWLLMIVTVGLAVGFGRSENLTTAYGVATSVTMLITSVLLFIATREIWHWPLAAAGIVAGMFVTIDVGFFASKVAKFVYGGWVPLLLAAMVYGVMWIWHRGAVEVQRSVEAELTPLSSLLERLHAGEVARVPGTAVFFTRVKDKTPPVLDWHVRHNRVLHEYVLALTLTVLSAPRTRPDERLNLEHIDDKFSWAEARRGFMELPDIPQILKDCKAKGAKIDLDDVTYYVAHETVIPRDGGNGIPRWQQALFAALGRNAESIADYLELPFDRVVEIGREIEI